MTDEIKALAEEKLSEAHEILTELCQLKSYKDNVGKDSFYQERQPVAWARANQFLNSMIGYKAALSGTERVEGDWKLEGHCYQISDMGDYDGHWEITNGKISLLTKDDNDEVLQPIVNALNSSGVKFYMDDAAEFEAKMYKEMYEELSKGTERVECYLPCEFKEADTLAKPENGEIGFWLKKVTLTVVRESDYEPSKEQSQAPVASHSCTSSNSIEQEWEIFEDVVTDSAYNGFDDLTGVVNRLMKKYTITRRDIVNSDEE